MVNEGNRATLRPIRTMEVRTLPQDLFMRSPALTSHEPIPPIKP
jgi:hypothetical protein